VGIFVDLGLIYPLMGSFIGSVLPKDPASLPTRSRQRLALALTYFAIAFSPLIAFGNAIGFEQPLAARP